MPNPDRLIKTYLYDPLDRLVGTRTNPLVPTQRFYNREHLTTELQGSVPHSVFQYGNQLLAEKQFQGQTALVATDQQRSVLHSMNATDARAQAYDAYGHHRAQSGLGSLLGFNGEHADRLTGHYLLGNGHRAYNPVLMRFNSPDRLSPFGKGGLNAYAYCGGDPINKVDPSGREFLDFLDIPTVFAIISLVISFSAVLPSTPVAQSIIAVYKNFYTPAELTKFVGTALMFTAGTFTTIRNSAPKAEDDAINQGLMYTNMSLALLGGMSNLISTKLSWKVMKARTKDFAKAKTAAKAEAALEKASKKAAKTSAKSKSIRSGQDEDTESTWL